MLDPSPATPSPAARPVNRLAAETSPYLLQHAHNPVDWYPWGPEAFDAARRRDCPIFLSIGYSTCYWCHVMERQVFENPHLATLMNHLFVCIKVDREQRPDLDDLYMTALQLTTGTGGWPMSLFLTPPAASQVAALRSEPLPPPAETLGLLPFYAGTYFPPIPTGNMPGFDQVLRAVADAWRLRRADVLAQARQIAQAVREHLEQPPSPSAAPLNAQMVQDAVSSLLRTFDHAHGGFGSAPKFPQPPSLRFLLQVYRENRDDDLRHALTHTLDRMARGGLFDQIAGGFHRYSVDEHWLVPHFEKMLYDQGQLLELYGHAQQIMPLDGDPDFFARILRQTADYLLRSMTDPTGAFASAQDAEVAGREGAPYVWIPEAFAAAIPDPALTRRARQMYGLDHGPNFRAPHHPDAPPSNVLYLPRSLPELAQNWKLPLSDVVSLKQHIDHRLLAARDRLPQPMTDDKILASWNGLAIAGLAVASQVLTEPSYAEAAARAADAILRHMTSNDGSLYHMMHTGTPSVPGFLEDYAHLSHGLIELHRATGDVRWLREATRLTDLAADRFRGFDTVPGQADLFARPRSRFDGALPSARSQLVHNLLDIYASTREQRFVQTAAAELCSLSPDLQQHAPAMPHMVHALFRILHLAPEFFETRTPSAGEADAVTAELTPQPAPIRGARANFQVILNIAPGHHVYAHSPGEDALPTTLTLTHERAGQLQVQYPPGSPLTDGLSVYQGRVTLPATLILPAGPPPASVQLLLRYQPCTDRYCLPPQQQTLLLRLASPPATGNQKLEAQNNG